MKNLVQPVIILCFSILFTSCFEITEEVDMNNNGSGNVTLTVNLSESKDNLKAYWKMDQVQGVEVPKKTEIDEEIQNVKKALSAVKGISNVTTTADYDEFVFTISGSFDNVKTLNKGINAVVSELNRTPMPTIKKDNFAFAPGKFTRLFKYAGDLKLNDEEYDNLNMTARFVMETARVVSIYRFEKPVKSFSNRKAQLSPSKKAVKFESNIADLIKGKASIENEIIF
jgi:hypothetical protein